MGGRGCAGWSGVKGWKWDNCNSIINKYIKKKEKQRHVSTNKLIHGRPKYQLPDDAIQEEINQNKNYLRIERLW